MIRSSAKTIPNECDGTKSTVDGFGAIPNPNGTIRQHCHRGKPDRDNIDLKRVKIPPAMLRYTDKPDR
jgi:hypothetical protein